MAINGLNLRALNPMQRLDASPMVKGPENSTLNGIQRPFAGVHNLHQNDGFRNAFHRVQPKAAQVKEYVGKDLNKLATFKPENGIPVAKLRVSSQGPGEFISASRAAKNHNKVQAGYESLHRELQHLEPPPGQRQKGFLSAIRKLFGMDKPKAELNFKVERDNPPAAQAAEGQPHAAAAAGDPAAQAQPAAAAGKIKLTITSGNKPELAQKAGEPVSFTAQDTNLYESKVGRRKAAWLGAAGVGVGAGIALAITVPVVGWIVGGAMVGGIVLKAAFGKSPWWGKTAEGQMQKSARQEARHAADAIAQMVKNQVLCDTTEHNLGAPEDGFQKQSVLSDKNMLTDFVALARQDNPKALHKRVKQFVMSSDSPLPKEVRDLAGQRGIERGLKWLWPGNWFQGDPKGHARKTVDLMTQEIARGIMQGVQEGVLQSVVLDLSNELSNDAREELYKVPLPRIEQFQKAVAKLYPSANENRHPIYKADETLSDLKAFQNGSTRDLLRQLQDKAGTIGEENVNSYSELLRKLDGDISTHIASMEQIQALLGPPASEGEPPLNTVANIQARMIEMAGGQLDEAELTQAKTQIDDQLQLLRSRIASDNDTGTDKLVQSHAQQMLQLMDDLGQAADLSLQAARQLAQIRSDFSEGDPPPTMAKVREHLSSLDALSQNYIDPLQGNPAENSDLSIAQTQGKVEADRIKGLCEGLIKAYDAANNTQGIMAASLDKAAAGDLAAGLSFDVLERIEDQRFAQEPGLQGWSAAGFVKPGDLQAYGKADIEAFRSQACARAIGLPAEDVESLQAVLLTLSQGDKNEVIQLLRSGAQDDPSALRTALIQLQDLLPAQEDTQTAAESKALQSLAALSQGRLFGASLEPCQQVVQSLHPRRLDVLNRYQQVHAIDRSLRQLFKGELGEKLYAWGTKQNLVEPNGWTNHGYDPNLTLKLLHSFSLQPQPGRPANSERLGKLAAEWPEAGKVEEWSLNPQVLKTLNADNLSLVDRLVETVAMGFGKQMREEQLKAQAMAKVKADQIVEGGMGSSDPQVRAAVAQAGSAKDPAQIAQLQAVAQDMRLLQQDQEDVQRQQRLDAGDIAKLSTFIKGKLGYKGSAQELAKRISENPELSAEFMLLIDTGVRLAGAESPPLIRPVFTQDQLLAGADALATYVPHKYLDSLPPTLRPMVEQRNAMIEKIKATKPGPERARLLGKDLKVGAYVESFLNEEYAYNLLARNENLDLPAKSIRIILDNTADSAERQQLNVEMTRSATLTEPNLKKIQAALGASLNDQEKALSRLEDEAQQKYGPAMSTYMQEQMALIAAQKQAAQRLPEAYLKPETGDLAHMGQLLRQANGLKGKTQAQIQRAYIKGQNQASQEALKYFDIRRFDARRPGFFGRLIFSIMRRGQPLSRLLRSAGEEKNALGRAINDLVRARQSEQFTQQQLEFFEARITALQAAKDALTSDSKKIKDALIMVAAEHLGGKQGPDPRITEADLQTILGQWKAILAGASQDCFPEIERQAANLLNQSVNDLELQLSADEKGQLALDLGRLMREQDALVAEHQDIRAQLMKIDLADQKVDPKILRLYQAGLDRSDQGAVEALEASLSSQSRDTVNLLEVWRRAGDMLQQDPATALQIAGRQLRTLEQTLQNPGNLTPQMRGQLRRLKDSLEDAFLARMGPSAPTRLERTADAAGTIKIAGKATELKKTLDDFNSKAKLEEWIKKGGVSGKGQAGQPGVAQYLNDLHELDMNLRDQLLQHPIEQLKGAESPRSLRALSELASARIAVGQIYSRLSAVSGDLSNDLMLSGDAVDKQAMKSKADSHLYGGLFMQQELRDKNNRWSPDPKVSVITRLPTKDDDIKQLRQACEGLSARILRGKNLTAAETDLLDAAAERLLDMGMMQSQVDDSMDESLDLAGFRGNADTFKQAFVS